MQQQQRMGQYYAPAVSGDFPVSSADISRRRRRRHRKLIEHVRRGSPETVAAQLSPICASSERGGREER